MSRCFRLARLDVRAVAEKGNHDRDQHQGRRLGSLDPHDAAEERDRRADDRDRIVQAEHLSHLVARHLARGQHDRGEDLRGRQNAPDLRRGKHGTPRDPAEV